MKKDSAFMIGASILVLLILYYSSPLVLISSDSEWGESYRKELSKKIDWDSKIQNAEKKLTQEQINSLCKFYNEQTKKDCSYANNKNVFSEIAIEFLDVKKKTKNIKTVFGCKASMCFTVYKDRVYNIAGGIDAPFMIDIKTKGDTVDVLKEYGDHVTTQSLLAVLPTKYKMMYLLYDPIETRGGKYKVNEILEKKVEKGLGILVEKDYCMHIDENKGTFEIFDLIETPDTETEDGTCDVIIKDKGKLSELWS